jgi:hypothetical protein
MQPESRSPDEEDGVAARGVSPGSFTSEEARIREAYARREEAGRYSWFSAGHLFIVQERERRLLALLKRYGCVRLDKNRGSSGFRVGNRSAPSPSSEGEGGGEGAGKRRLWRREAPAPWDPPRPPAISAGGLAEALHPQACPRLPPGSVDPLTQPSPPRGARVVKDFTHPHDFRKSPNY